MSSTCTGNALYFGFTGDNGDGGTHVVEVPASANGEIVFVVDTLNAVAATNYLQARTKCTAPTSGAAVTFTEVLLAPGDATASPAPSLQPTVDPGMPRHASMEEHCVLFFNGRIVFVCAAAAVFHLHCVMVALFSRFLSRGRSVVQTHSSLPVCSPRI